MNNLLQWWLNLNPLTEEENEYINYTLSKTVEYNDKKFKEITKEYFRRMPFCNITVDTNKLSFNLTATDFINALFDKYVDDETLVLYSNCEHDNVMLNVNKCKNKFEINHYNHIRYLNINDIINESKKYKKVFLYCIGTQISSGEITPQYFFETIKQAFIDNNIKNIMILDDVHGMFLTPRDYSIFDYIIGTAHALVRYYDMGILISKNDEYFGYKSVNWGLDYLKALDVVLKRKNKLHLFNIIMEEYFSKYLATKNFQLFERTTHNIFSLKCFNIKFPKSIVDKLEKYEIRIENPNGEYPMIRFRAQQYIKRPDFLTDGLKVLEEYLNVFSNK